jgi:hypothetical protein
VLTKFATALAATAALVAAAIPATASASPPYNYGHCVAYEAMFGGPVPELTRFFSPVTAFEDENGDITKIVGPKSPDGIGLACGVTP